MQYFCTTSQHLNPHRRSERSTRAAQRVVRRRALPAPSATSPTSGRAALHGPSSHAVNPLEIGCTNTLVALQPGEKIPAPKRQRRAVVPCHSSGNRAQDATPFESIRTPPCSPIGPKRAPPRPPPNLHPGRVPAPSQSRRSSSSAAP